MPLKTRVGTTDLRVFQKVWVREEYKQLVIHPNPEIRRQTKLDEQIGMLT
jgi:hypothetical protein